MSQLSRIGYSMQCETCTDVKGYKFWNSTRTQTSEKEKGVCGYFEDAGSCCNIYNRNETKRTLLTLMYLHSCQPLMTNYSEDY